MLSGCSLLVYDVSGSPLPDDGIGAGISQEQCSLCGSDGKNLAARLGSDLGVIRFHTGEMIGVPVVNGLEKETKEGTGNYSSSYPGSDGSESKISFSSIEGRGICEIDIDLNEDSVFDIGKAANYFCSDCLEKIEEIDGELKDFMDSEDLVDTALIDLTDRKLYSLNRMQKSYFIRDYYIHIDRKEESLEVLVVDAPLR